MGNVKREIACLQMTRRKGRKAKKEAGMQGNFGFRGVGNRTDALSSAPKFPRLRLGKARRGECRHPSPTSPHSEHLFTAPWLSGCALRPGGINEPTLLMMISSCRSRFLLSRRSLLAGALILIYLKETSEQCNYPEPEWWKFWWL